MGSKGSMGNMDWDIEADWEVDRKAAKDVLKTNGV
jgi:hypothetical protein